MECTVIKVRTVLIRVVLNIVLAVKFGRMSKKQRDQLYVEVMRHQTAQPPPQHHHHQAAAAAQAAEAHYLAQYANITPVQYMQQGYPGMRNRNSFTLTK